MCLTETCWSSGSVGKHVTACRRTAQASAYWEPWEAWRSTDGVHLHSHSFVPGVAKAQAPGRNQSLSHPASCPASLTLIVARRASAGSPSHVPQGWDS